MDLREAIQRHGAPLEAEEPLRRILAALREEPDPHTTVRPEDAVAVHVADSLAALAVDEVRAARRIADIGAGAGFPGLPLASALPGAQVDLIEASGRKAGVISRLAAAGGLENARAVPARAEEWAAGEGRVAYDVVTARAVGPLPVLLEYAAPLLREGGLLIAWKGRRDPAEEAAGARAADAVGFEPADVLAVQPYPASRDRHLHLYRKSRPTPERFPRRPGVAARRPLG